ncbi:possible tyrosine transporter P-protein [Cohaesibacter sp. ES.047]|uniref:SLC13 family permease n=1 Tax=Cohaesibacter sp. ES.047 TaxID=1798205 RepID=UPI000BB8586A|nr:ArsB/NhaD family transporter [Cohaesibacter sp. ES.047]SNY90109.1 possible tyrosine transporter P-protein [Cohaesibacter sp. ES.047]
MEHASELATSAAFGLPPMIVATVILIAAYFFIITEKVNRAIVSLLGAGLLVLLGVLNFKLVVEGIDFNTIFLLIGMMVIVAITRESGVFQFVAIYTAKAVKANPRMLLAALAIITAVFSALLDNVTTVLLIVPVTLLLTDQLNLRAYPFLFSQIFASNVGGTSTLIGDPPNILIGSAVGLGFMDFVDWVGPPALIVLIFCLVFFDFLWGRKMKASEEDKAAMMQYNAFEAIEDKVLLVKSLITLALVLFGFIYGHGLGWAPGTIALTGAAFLLLLHSFGGSPEEQSHKVHKFFQEVEWETIFFFLGLFVLVYGVEHTGLLKIVASEMLSVTGTNIELAGMLILGSSAVLSAIVDNIPFVATMIPLIKAMQADLGGPAAIEPLWWCLSLGACLGGNGTLIGASANVMVASFAERAGQRISFVQFLKLAFPLMLFTTAISAVYAYLFYF